MSYRHVKLPESGQKITISDNKLVVSDNPILGFIEGDGIGPDITTAAMRVWDAAVEKAYGGKQESPLGRVVPGRKSGRDLRRRLLPGGNAGGSQGTRRCHQGPVDHAGWRRLPLLNVSLRQELDLYACVRPVRYFDGVPSPMKQPGGRRRRHLPRKHRGRLLRHRVPVRHRREQKTGQIPARGDGREFFEDAGLGIKPMSPFGSKRLVRKAIQYAIDNGRDSVTLVHKGNIMKFTEGAFRNWGYEMAREEFGDRPSAKTSCGTSTMASARRQDRDQGPHRRYHVPADAAAPGRVRVLATMNLNGDYLSDAWPRRSGVSVSRPAPTSPTTWRSSRPPTARRRSTRTWTRSTPAH